LLSTPSWTCCQISAAVFEIRILRKSPPGRACDSSTFPMASSGLWLWRTVEFSRRSFAEALIASSVMMSSCMSKSVVAA